MTGALEPTVRAQPGSSPAKPKITAEKDIATRRICDGPSVLIREVLWSDGGAGYEVWTITAQGEDDEDLTGPQGSFDQIPTEQQIADLWSDHIQSTYEVGCDRTIMDEGR